MIYHVLPGDAQVEHFLKSGLEGAVIVFREALISGPVAETDPNEFWDQRSRFILGEYGDDVIAYHEKVADEIEKLSDIAADDEANLWFEYELFCGVNMWFCLDRLKDSGAPVYRVAPLNASPDDVWKGFGKHDADDLRNCFDARTEFTREDIEMGSRLWQAFRRRNALELLKLGEYRSPCYPFLREVCEAAAELDTRPAAIVRELKSGGLSDIESVFPEFQKRAGVYGFGDSQVERLLQTV